MNSSFPPDRNVSDLIEDVRRHPELHRHELAGLIVCCTVDGVLNTALLEAHQELGPRDD